ncbi:MAG: glycosyltransferase family 9 protein [Verrucomicrobiota bacterium]
MPKGSKPRGAGGGSSSDESLLGLASTLIGQGDTAQGRRILSQVLTRHPGNRMAHLLLNHVFVKESDWAGMRQAVERQADLRIPPATVAWNRSLVSLRLGDMPEGWDQYEARWQLPGLVIPERNFQQPRWQGQPFVGRTLLLHFEQGLGDTLMFVRYAKQAKALGGRVLLAAQIPLADLVATCPGVDEVIPHGAPLPPFDFHLPLLSLPAIFRTVLDSIPAEVPYLDVPTTVPNRKWIARTLAASEGQTRIGLVWAGSRTHKGDAQRSILPSAFEALGALPGVAWHSFQIDTVELPALPGLISLDPMLRNLSSTAYALSGMDLVITVDTALAHLAGALGVPTLLLLPFFPDWRWLLGREDSPWYPTLRLYRQSTPGDWPGVLRRVVADLSIDPPPTTPDTGCPD